jgi:hypothetical protein
MNRITPLIKGLITGVLMVLTSLVLIYTKQPPNTTLNYIGYILYASGIAWTLLAYSRSETYTPTFGAIFGQGFRCFIIVTLIVVIFTGIYSSMHPEIAEEAARHYREDLVKEGNKTPAEIDSMITAAKKQFVTGNISLAIFGTLIMGTIFTAAGAGLLLIRKK